MKEEQAKCWERVQYFYNFRMKRGIEARPTNEQLRELKSQAHKHTYMMRMEVGPKCEGLAGIDPVDILRRDAKEGPGLAMAGLASSHFTDEAIAEGEKADTHWVLAEALDNQWRICVARAEYDRSCLSPYPFKEVNVLHASRLYGRFPRAQGWAPLETKDARELGMGLYAVRLRSNCGKWAPEAPVYQVREHPLLQRQVPRAMGAPMQTQCPDSLTCSNAVAHKSYCDRSKLLAPPGAPATSHKFVFPTAVNIYKADVNRAIVMLGEHGMTNMNVLIHCTRRIDMGRDEVEARGTAAACDVHLRGLGHAQPRVHEVRPLPPVAALLDALCAVPQAPCDEAACEMVRTPRRLRRNSSSSLCRGPPRCCPACSPSTRFTGTLPRPTQRTTCPSTC